MANPIDYCKIIEIPQGELREGMVLAETFTYDYAEQRNADAIFSARFGKPLTPSFVGVFNKLSEHPEIVRRRTVEKVGGKDTAPVQVFEVSTERQRNWIEAFAQDFIVRERATEELRDYRRLGGGVAIARLDSVIKRLFKDIATSEKDIQEFIKTKTRGHNALEDLLRDVDFRRQIQDGILDPIAENPLINTYLSYAPHERDHALDVTTLTVRAAFEAGIVDGKQLYDVAISCMMHDIGRQYLLAMMKRKKIPAAMMNLHAIYLVEKILVPGEKPLDGLTWRQINLMKHSHTRRDGHGPKEPTRDNRGRVYVGRNIGMHDSSDLLLKIAGWKRLVEEGDIKQPYIVECPEDHSEIVALSERWITGITHGTTKLEAGKLLQEIRDDAGLFARGSYTGPFLEILERCYFSG